MKKTCGSCKHRDNKQHQPPCVNCGRKTHWEPTISRAAILERYPEDEFLLADGFDDAIIGVDENTMRIIYSVEKCIAVLKNDMEEEEAHEYFEYNVRGGYVGEKTPIWCEDLF